jgi:hypothetical protein
MRRVGGRRARLAPHPASSGPDAGLCATCREARQVTSSRGSTFWLCGLSARDPRFAKYPQLPVLRCEGFAERPRATPPGHEEPAQGGTVSATDPQLP